MIGEAMRRILCCVLLLGSLLGGTDAFADARTKARRAFNEGMRLIAARQFERGIDRLIEANDTLPHPNVQYNIAQAYLALGRDAEALKWLESYLSFPVPQADAERVGRELEDVKRRMQPAPPPEKVSGTDEAPLTTVPNLTVRDLHQLESLADALRNLSTDRAKELDDITARLKGNVREEPPPPAPPPPPPDQLTAPQPIEEGGLRAVEEYEEREVVSAATRELARPEDAPAVVWVITQREIRDRGYETIAEALRAISGLHVIDDHVFVDVGVRGVHGDLRGMSRIIKVLVDGHPVAFRPTSGHFLGLEAIPIRAVDRIELIRGPASALYGANAFLAVLQIVTRRGSDIRGGAVAGRFGLSTSTEDASGKVDPKVMGTGDAIVGTKEGDLSFVLSAQGGHLDRSGLRIPETSPFAGELSGSTGGVSKKDTATPFSLFGSLELDLHGKGQINLSGGVQRLDAHGEWLDYGALTHFTEISLINIWTRLTYDLAINKEAGLRAFTSYARGGPNASNRIRPLTGFTLRPNELRHLEESFQSQAIFSGLEVRWDLSKYRFGVRAGADVDVDLQKLNSARAFFDGAEGENQAGESIPVSASSVPDTTFTNVGLYLQLDSQPLEFFDVIGGLRYDFQSLYGSNLNGRLGAVVRATDWLFFKALYGSSFRAPAADQLYRQAAYVGDTTGCLDYAPCAAVDLKPQTAHTGELVAGVAFSKTFNAQVTGFISYVDDLILSFPNNANAFITTNAGTRLSRGVEVESSVAFPGLAGALDLSAHAYFALQGTDSDIPEALFQPAESIRAEFREESLFPSVTAGGGLDLAYLPLKVGLYLEGRYVGKRRASGSNLALSAGFSNYDGDDLPGYFELDMNLSTRDLYLFEGGETVLSLRVTDALGIDHAEGGFRGWDIPTPGRLIFFRIIQEY
jgi:outer membrane receptor protein involved in Fe transport